MGQEPAASNLITIHLGNGASMAAVKGGRCTDTSLGMTTLAGLVMGSRCGDLDPGLILYLANQLGMGLEEIGRMLNQESGLKGLCGDNDLRRVLKLREEGDERARLALAVYSYRIKKYIGAYMAVLGRTDALVFTAGVGENSPQVRAESCAGLEGLGIELDQEANQARLEGIRDIATVDSKVRVLVVPTNEELMIARQTRAVLTSQT